MSQFETVDMFTDKAVAKQPHAYFEHLRQQGPSTRLPTRPEVVAVTGYDAGPRRLPRRRALLGD